jgi:hypothetical protein
MRDFKARVPGLWLVAVAAFLCGIPVSEEIK